MVIGIECFSSCDYMMKIVRANKLDHVLTILKGKVEEVDFITIDGLLLLSYELMLNTGVWLPRDKWLVPNGLICPDRATLVCNSHRGPAEQSLREPLAGEHVPLTPCIKDVAISWSPWWMWWTPSSWSPTCLIKEVDISTVNVEDLTVTSPFCLQVKANGYMHALVADFNIELTCCHIRRELASAQPLSPHPLP